MGDTAPSYYVGREGSAPDPEDFPYQVLYSAQMPTPGYTHYPCKTFEAAKKKALALAARDNKPGSGVFENLIFVERYDVLSREWEGYTEDGDDLDDLVFGDIEGEFDDDSLYDPRPGGAAR